MKDKDLFMKMEFKKNEFKNVLKSKGVAIENVIKNVTEVDGKVKVKVKDKLGQITEIVFRSEELTPYQRFVCFEGCFTEDTLVKTIDGDKKISQIKDGDLVLAKHHYTGEIGYRKAELIEKLAEEIVEIRVCGQTIEATPSHLFKTDKGWVAAKDLEIGNNVELQNNGYAVVENVNKKNYNKNKVYNLEVEEYHTFYITELGILVHNEYKHIKIKDIYDKFYKGIPDNNKALKDKFVGLLDELDELDLRSHSNKEIVQRFHESFNNVKEVDIEKINEIIDNIPKWRAELETLKSKRLTYMGNTPGKNSKTGQAVKERMRKEKKIDVRRDGTEIFMDSEGKWHPIEDADMAHKIDAVSWWNNEGRFYGPKSEEVRNFMLNPDNYYLEYFAINRSQGAKLGETYLPPIEK